MISAERKAELEAANFYVEDMGATYGPGWWEGQFRWMRKGTDEFQDSDTSISADLAWAECDRYFAERQSAMTHEEVVAELDSLLGAPNGQPIILTAPQQLLVTKLQQKLSAFLIEI